MSVEAQLTVSQAKEATRIAEKWKRPIYVMNIGYGLIAVRVQTSGFNWSTSLVNKEGKVVEEIP